MDNFWFVCLVDIGLNNLEKKLLVNFLYMDFFFFLVNNLRYFIF